MPGNMIKINNAIEYYVGDSKMDALIAWLDKNGIKQEVKKEKKEE